MPTTAAQPYFHQPSVAPISTAMRGTPGGSTPSLYDDVWRSNTVVEGIETTRTAMPSSASCCCALSASCTSEPVAMITTSGLVNRPTSLGSASTEEPHATNTDIA